MSTLAAWLAFWPALAVVGVANGVLRELTFGRHLPERTAHRISTLTAGLLCGAAAWVFSRWWPVASTAESALIGGAWVAMTVAFEVAFGHWVAGHSWARLLEDYDLRRGRVWPFFLLWLALLPWLVG